MLVPDDLDSRFNPLSVERAQKIAIAISYVVSFTFFSSADLADWKDRLHQSSLFVLLSESEIMYFGYQVIKDAQGIKFFAYIGLDLETNELVMETLSAYNTIAVLKEVCDYLGGMYVDPPLRSICVRSPVVHVNDTCGKVVPKETVEQELREMRGVISNFSRDAVVVNHNKFKSLKSRCWFCYKAAFQCESKKLLKCGRCSLALYCSRECQKDHWKNHKDSCVVTPS